MDTAADSYWKVYEEYTKTVRTWFVAYGIGAPVLVLGNEKLWRQLAKDDVLSWVGLLFITGGALQVLLAMFNRWASWHHFHAKFRGAEAGALTRAERAAKWWLGQFWIDVSADLVSLITFVVGTVVLFRSAGRLA